MRYNVRSIHDKTTTWKRNLSSSMINIIVTTDDFRSSVEGGPPSNASIYFSRKYDWSKTKKRGNTGTWILGNPEYFLKEKKPSQSSPEYSLFDGHFQMRQIISLSWSPTLDEHTDKDFRNENFIVNMGLLKRWITSLPVHGSVPDPDFQRRGGGGGSLRCSFVVES